MYQKRSFAFLKIKWGWCRLLVAQLLSLYWQKRRNHQVQNRLWCQSQQWEQSVAQLLHWLWSQSFEYFVHDVDRTSQVSASISEIIQKRFVKVLIKILKRLKIYHFSPERYHERHQVKICFWISIQRKT